MSLPATLDTVVEVSWDGSGAYTGLYDDVTAAQDVPGDPGVGIDEGKDGARSLSPPKIPASSFELYNEDGRYSQERADSPVYQRVLTGRPLRISALHGTESAYTEDDDYRADDYYDGEGTWRLASGYIDDLAQRTSIGDQRVGIDALGTLGKLITQPVSVAVHASIRTDEAITLLLDAAGWPADLRAISIGDTTLLYWWCDERSPWAAMLELLASEGPGALYQDGSGVLHFENRNYRTITARSTTSQATFLDRSGGVGVDEYTTEGEYTEDGTYAGPTALWMTALSYEPGFKNIYNRATFSTKRRTLGALAQVWQYGATLTLSANQALTLIVRPSDPFQNAVTPANGVDYTVTSGSLASVSLAATSGLVAFLTITAGASGATVDGVTSTGIQLRAQPLTVVSETTVQNSVDASASIATFGEQTLQISGWPEIDPAQAEAVCNAWVARYMEQRPTVTITVRNADGNHLEQILARGVSDRITLEEANTGLSADVWIESKHLSISGAGGRRVECLFACEKVDTVSGAIWDVSLWDDPSSVWGV